MNMLRFFTKSTAYTCGKLCRQYLLLAGLVLLCLFLPGILGNAAQDILSEGVDFSSVSLAVTAPEDDPLPQLLEEYMVRMQDVSRYCSFHAMDKQEALNALEKGDVVAVLELPADFIEGILYGANPDVTLIVSQDRPVESLLTLWLGQSLTDLLSSVQSGVYAVLDAYDLAPVEGLSRDRVIAEINLRYINWTLERQDVYRTVSVSATGALPVATHYALSLLIWLCLSLSPLFFPVYEASRLVSRRRLRSIGWGSAMCCLSDITACAVTVFPIALVSLAVALKGHFGTALLCAAALALFCALFGSLCSLVTGSAARCGSLSFLVSLAGLTLAGGILPPVMLPQSLQRISWLSPITWLRNIAAAGLGYDAQGRCFAALGVTSLVMLLLVFILYRKRMDKQEVSA